MYFGYSLPNVSSTVMDFTTFYLRTEEHGGNGETLPETVVQATPPHAHSFVPEEPDNQLGVLTPNSAFDPVSNRLVPWLNIVV